VHVGRFVNDRVEHRTYTLDERIPLDVPGVAAEISVRDIYAGLLK
jgi:hypothetical protein